VTEKCNVDPDCTLPVKVDALIVSLDNFEKRRVVETEKAESDREHYRKKQDEILTTIKKIDITLHGDDTQNIVGIRERVKNLDLNVNGNEEVGFKGLRDEVCEINKVIWVARFMDGIAEIIKRPLVIFIVIAVITSVVFGIPIIDHAKQFLGIK